MFDLGGTELLLIGIVALVVVGPKELPTMFRAIGMLTGRAREMAREFTSAMNSAADQTGLQEINKTIKAATNPAMFGMNKMKGAAGLKTPPVVAKPVVAAAVTAPAVVAEGAAANPVEVKAAYVPNGATEKLAADRAALKAKLADEAAARKLVRANAISNPPGVAPIAVPVVEPVVVAAKKTVKPRAKPKPKVDAAPPIADETP